MRQLNITKTAVENNRFSNTIDVCVTGNVGDVKVTTTTSFSKTPVAEDDTDSVIRLAIEVCIRKLISELEPDVVNTNENCIEENTGEVEHNQKYTTTRSGSAAVWTVAPNTTPMFRFNTLDTRASSNAVSGNHAVVLTSNTF